MLAHAGGSPMVHEWPTVQSTQIFFKIAACAPIRADEWRRFRDGLALQFEATVSARAMGSKHIA